MAVEQSSGRPNSPGMPDKNTSWVGGWYVFEDGNVVGPLEASDAFSRSEKTESGQSRMVSRKGFTQWYPLQDFAAIHAMAGRYSDYLAQSKTATPNIETPIVVAQQVGPDAVQHQLKSQDKKAQDMSAINSAQRDLSSGAQPQTDRIKFARTSDQVQSSSVGKKLSAKERKRLAEEERRSRKIAEKQAKQAAQNNGTTNASKGPSFEQQYLQVASRLRLGRPTSPVLGALVYFPLSLGVYWWAWLSKTGEEVSWHLNGASRMNFIVPMWMCMIPGVHMILAYLVARMVRQMEEQNGYRTINPWVASLAALFPPVYMIMIQSAMNRHWRLHVYHSATK